MKVFLLYFCVSLLLSSITLDESTKLAAGVYQNQLTKNITKMVISCQDGQLYATTYLGCTSRSCMLKTIQLKNTTKKNSYTGSIKKGFSTKKIHITPLPNKIKVTIINTFSDGRPNQSISAILNCAKKMEC